MLRRSSIILWLATYTAITLCSPGLHGLTDSDHGRVSAAASQDDDARMRGESSSPTVSAAHAPADDDGHCPICSYLSQVQAAPDAALTEDAGRVAFAPEPRAAVSRIAIVPLPSLPRAPPRPTSAHA